MAAQNEHGKLIAAAAKAALTPLGLVRKGQSRVWWSDQRHLIISVEFQPSGWSKGSYLKVGACWLWDPIASIGVNAGYRLGDVGDAGFLPFESVEQFRPRVEHMANRAAEEVIAIRERFKTFSHIHRNVLWRANRTARVGWLLYHAGVTSGLTGDIATARWFFKRLADWPSAESELRYVNGRIAKLAVMLDDPPRFRAEILNLIQQTRKLNRFPADPHCLDDALDSTSGR